MLFFKVSFLVLFMVGYSRATTLYSVNTRLNNLESKNRRFEKLTGKMDVFSIKATSAGKSDGNMCNIQLNNGENICLQQRGYNVVAFDPYTGQLLSRSFDTHNKGEKDKMITFLKNVPYGFVIVLSVKDEASWQARFNKDDEKFMATLGISGGACRLRIGYRYSFAIITAKTITGVAPSWRKCSHSPAHGGKVDIEVNFQIP